MMKIISFLLSAIVVLSPWAAKPVHTEILIGIAGPLSGSSLTQGEQQEVGAQAAVDH